MPKLITTELILPDHLDIEPIQMLDPQAATRLPFEGNHVPLSMFDKEFDKVQPLLEACGAAAIRMSIGRPFGFMTGQLTNPNQTQLTPDLTFIQPGSGQRWVLGVQTEQPLTAHDQQIFTLGAYKYASFIQTRIKFPFSI